MTTLGIGSIVDVRATIAPSGRVQMGFGRTLLLTTDPTLEAGAGRVWVFASMDEVARVFPPGSGPYQAAQVYFSQAPYPRNLVIGRWLQAGEPARLTGGAPLPLEEITGRPTVLTGGSPASLDTFHGRATVLTGGSPASLDTFYGRATVVTGTGTVASLDTFHGRATVVTGTGTVASLTTLQGITSGTVTFLSQTLTGLDFSGDNDLDGVASTLQTALRATSSTDLDNVEVAYDSAASAFVVTLPLDSSTGVVPTASAAFTGDDADELGLDTATIVNGVDAIVSGTVTFLSETVTGLDFSAVTDYDGVASVLQTALRATSETDLDQVEVAYDGSAFVLTLPLDSNGVVPTASAAFTGDDADELGLDTATIVNGVDAIVSGTVTFLSETVTGLDFSSVTDYDGVASVLQTALRGTSATSLDDVEVVYDSTASVFVVTIPLDSQGEATSVSAAFTGDDADELGLDSATIVDGVDAITNGTVTFLSETVTGLDFSSVTDYDGVASVLQTALQGTSATGLDEVEVAYDGTQFVVTLSLASDGSATEVTDPFTGDTADDLGLDTVDTTPGIGSIGAGSLSWQGATISGLDFTTATSYGDVASILQAALRAVTAPARADLRSASVTYDPAGFFRVSLGFRMNGNPYPIAGFMLDVSQGPAYALGLDSASGGSIAQGHASETIEEVMDTISGLDDSWYFVAVDSGITAATDLLSLSRWVQSANNYMLALDVTGDNVLAQGETSSLAAQVSALEQERTFVVWSRTADHKALSLAARLSTVNFDGQSTLITTKFKSLPGTTPDLLTTAQKEELDRKRVGYYTRFGPDAIFAEGWTQAGDWIDVRYWLDWITKAMQSEVYNLLRQHPTRVPQTAEGLASIEAAIERVCEAGRRNGGIAPGRVSETVANDIRLASNNPAFDGFLPTGYLVAIGSIADQLQIDRDARRSPTIRVWLKGSGAMHHITIGLVFTG